MRTLQTPADVLRFFADNETPLYYVGPTTYNVIGAEEWIGGLHFLTAVDSFASRRPNAFIPKGLPDSLNRIEEYNNALLSHPAVAEQVRSRGPGVRSCS